MPLFVVRRGVLLSTRVARRPIASAAQGQEPENFFVSAGFALTHPTSVTDITAIEAVRVEEIDEGAVSCYRDVVVVVFFCPPKCRWNVFYVLTPFAAFSVFLPHHTP